MYLQSIQIFEQRDGARLKIWLEPGYTYINGVLASWNFEVADVRLEIWVGAGCTDVESICISQILEIGDILLVIRVRASLLKIGIEACYIYEYCKRRAAK